MKKNIGNAPALYPTLLVAAGTTADGRFDSPAPKPVLFATPAYQYLRTGDVLGRWMSLGKEAKP